MVAGNRWRGDVVAGGTVALVAAPQCMAFATMAGLPPELGLYAAVVMALVTAALSSVPILNVGPSVTTATMVLAVLAAVEPSQPADWPGIAAMLAVLVGGFTILAGLLGIGGFVRFVSRSVLIGLAAGVAVLIFGAQLAPALGLHVPRNPTLAGLLYSTLMQLGDTHWPALLFSAGTLAMVLIGNRLAPRFATPFLALVLGGVVVWLCERAGIDGLVQTIGRIPRTLPNGPSGFMVGAYGSDLVIGAISISLVGIIQTLAIAKTIAEGRRVRLDARREVVALGASNLVAGVLHGFPGAGSYARTTLNEVSGAHTRLTNVFAALGIVLIVAIAAPLAQYVALPAISGLLVAMAVQMVDWREFRQILLHDQQDRIVLGTTLVSVLIMPVHWAVLLGLAVSIALFLRRVARLHLCEMVSTGDGEFHEREIDEQTGTTAITMLQHEGPLFFAHTEELIEKLRPVFARRPAITILRMRRTQQIDHSAITALDHVIGEYVKNGGKVVICGLLPKMHRLLRGSALGKTLCARCMQETTGMVFGSAHRAIQQAEEELKSTDLGGRPRFRTAAKSAT